MSVSKQILEVCKVGQGASCCKYLVCGSKGFECAKILPSYKDVVDQAWAKDAHVAQGDNCPGVSDLNLKPEPQ